MTELDHLECGVVVHLDDPGGTDAGLELEVFVDQEEGLAWGIWWRDDDQLMAVFAASSG